MTYKIFPDFVLLFRKFTTQREIMKKVAAKTFYSKYLTQNISAIKYHWFSELTVNYFNISYFLASLIFLFSSTKNPDVSFFIII